MFWKFSPIHENHKKPSDAFKFRENSAGYKKKRHYYTIETSMTQLPALDLFESLKMIWQFMTKFNLIYIHFESHHLKWLKTQEQLKLRTSEKLEFHFPNKSHHKRKKINKTAQVPIFTFVKSRKANISTFRSLFRLFSILHWHNKLPSNQTLRW